MIDTKVVHISLKLKEKFTLILISTRKVRIGSRLYINLIFRRKNNSLLQFSCAKFGKKYFIQFFICYLRHVRISNYEFFFKLTTLLNKEFNSTKSLSHLQIKQYVVSWWKMKCKFLFSEIFIWILCDHFWLFFSGAATIKLNQCKKYAYILRFVWIIFL